MDKEIIELLKTISGNAETVLIWYFVIDGLKYIIGWAAGISVCVYIAMKLSQADVRRRDLQKAYFDKTGRAPGYGDFN